MNVPLIHAGDCAVILVNYQNWQDTLACVQSISGLESPPKHIVIVENGSGNDSAAQLSAHLAAQFPLCCIQEGSQPPALTSHILLCLHENNGFSAGNNAAMRLLLSTTCRAFWLLNTDTLVTPSSLNALCTRLNERPDAACCGSTLIYQHDGVTVQCAGGTQFSPLLGTTTYIDGGKPCADVCAQPPEPVEARLGSLTGASLLVRREVVQTCGMMEEKYFLYYEDVEWCLRMRRRGWRLAWAPQSRVYHKEGGSSGAASAQPSTRSLLVDYLSIRNRFFLLKTYFPRSLPLALLSLLAVFVNRIRRGQIRRILPLLRAAVAGLRGEMGKPVVGEG